MNLSHLRQDYNRDHFNKEDLLKCPFKQFEKWFSEAQHCSDLEEPNAMCLATANASGHPSTRIVLLKGFSEKGLTFFTNYESRKSEEIQVNPKVAANFLWLPLRRQVNITGSVERISKAESMDYFRSRPFESRLVAWASPQSRVIASRSALEAEIDPIRDRFTDKTLPLPEHWGGYRIVPDGFEFWQGGPNRLHDRFLFRRHESDGIWVSERLAP